MILPYALAIFLACIVLSLVLNIWRLLTAPTVTDRILTLDTMTVNAIALVVAYGIWAGTGLYLEIAVIFALTGFVGSVAYCKYLLRGSIIE
ncbi:K+/H+ antiporter subunit F [Tabrizicola sp.]|jgi:multicomponent K+:H+ antiporter subunit F|uniref:K+/H+ antiporter subunit F n=1 Tax=Tabrizicola sp. TaxID=2005166 RepID=UPI0025DF5297|nr:K+/H+ antiporter subunit F [Tabrizicola sp.]MBY0351933.1 K+/H+ antiporter subunit F [Tabrizicola sp.]MDK2774331.1 K+/H+ antiporter subunit F [Tabrizicola sp.]